MEILEYCERDQTLTRENYYLGLLKPEYNIATDALAPMLGRKHTVETCKKMSIAHTGKIMSDEARKRNGEARIGKKFSAFFGLL